MKTRFGRLTIIKYYVGGAVRCMCDCGKEFVAERIHLHNGSKLDCGCGIASSTNYNEPEQYPVCWITTQELPLSPTQPPCLLPAPEGLPTIDEEIDTPDRSKITDGGFIYILLNRALPGLVKIGKTTKLPEKRAAELSTSSGVPLPYQVYYAVRVSDCHEAEKIIHKGLAEFRDNLAREFFNIAPENAKAAIESIISSWES
jgi:hypothetical protein